jgi:membrane-associated phospholipid phosphatase
VRTADQTQVAHFWADGAGTYTPPGHWNEIAQITATSQGNTTVQNARLFALLNIGLADAAIACWDAKYAYNYWRPITAIRNADTDGNPETAADPTWTPLIATPPFPEYSSGHSTFSRTAATILAMFYGTDSIPFTVGSDGLPGVTRSFNGFSAAADESGISRIYGGIHFPSGNLQGQACGYSLGQLVAGNFLQPLSAAVFTTLTRAGESTRLQLAVEPNTPYLIRASSDLKTWTDLGTVSSPTGIAEFTDNSPAGGQRFYQALAR